MIECLLVIAILEFIFNVCIYFMAKLFCNDVIIIMLLLCFFPKIREQKCLQYNVDIDLLRSEHHIREHCGSDLQTGTSKMT